MRTGLLCSRFLLVDIAARAREIRDKEVKLIWASQRVGADAAVSVPSRIEIFLQSRGMRVKVKHPFEPDLSLVRNALTLSETPIKEYRAPPLLGEHTQEVLGGKLGFDAEKIAALKQQGII